MSEKASRSFPWLATTVVLLVLPALYVLSVGGLCYLDAKRQLPVPGSNAASWVDGYSQPYRWLLSHGPLQGPLSRFAAWCHKQGAPPPPVHLHLYDQVKPAPLPPSELRTVK